MNMVGQMNMLGQMNIASHIMACQMNMVCQINMVIQTNMASQMNKWQARWIHGQPDEYGWSDEWWWVGIHELGDLELSQERLPECSSTFLSWHLFSEHGMTCILWNDMCWKQENKKCYTAQRLDKSELAKRPVLQNKDLKTPWAGVWAWPLGLGDVNVTGTTS